MTRFLALALAFAFAVIQPGAARAAEPAPGQWVAVGKSGGGFGGATVYCPARKQILAWGGLNGGNEVRAFDAENGRWTPDYEPDKAGMGGNFYGGQSHAGWVAATNRPGPFFLFRLACWDSTRNRLVIVAHNLTAAYDPATKKWTDLKAAFESADGKRAEGRAPARGEGEWFAPVPGQWGSCAYDPINDEILVFPLWITRSPYFLWKEPMAPERPVEAGLRAGHYGTMIFDCKTNTWRTPQLGPKEVLEARGRLAALINDQRAAARLAWAALIALRNEKPDEAAKLTVPAAEAQKTLNAKIKAEHDALARFGELWQESHSSDRATAAAKGLEPVLERAIKAQDGLAAAKPDQLPALCSQLQAVYRELRLVLAEDLAVQPPPRCSTSVVYDPNSKCIVMAGGDHLDRALNDTWVYDCAKRLWRRAAPAPVAADWPGMACDSKRGLVVYATEKGTFGFNGDSWVSLGAARPAAAYCDLAYDESRDLYVLNVANDKFGVDEKTFTMKPGNPGDPIKTAPAPRETVDDAPFPPPAESAALDRISQMPANTWLRAKPNLEPTHRSWSTMSWDPALRCVIYEGGGHAGTMDNTVSAYFPECNKWVNAFRTQTPPRAFGAWQCAGAMPAFERGMGLALHCRYYESFAGVIVHGCQAGFEWATRERPSDFKYVRVPFTYAGGFCLDPRGKVCQLGKAAYYDPNHGREIYVQDLATGEGRTIKTTGPTPQITGEWSAIAVQPDRNLLVVHGSGDQQKHNDTDTWVLDLADPASWKRLELKSTTPSVGMAKLNAISGADLLVCAMPASNDLWVLSLDRLEWKPLPAADGDDKLGPGRRRFELYGQCVYDPHHKVFIMVGLRGDYSTRYTYLLKPDFSKIEW